MVMSDIGWGRLALGGVAAAISLYAIAQAQGWTGGAQGSSARVDQAVVHTSSVQTSSSRADVPSSSNGATCTVPADYAMPHPVPPPAGQVRRTRITRYTLALSWSPGHCARDNRTDADDDSGADMQCSGAAGSFGFILHGLWPETDGRDWPQYCAPTRVIARQTLDQHLCMTPSPQLMQHEWAKHGSCMARTPEAYFDRASSLYSRVAMPDMRSMAARRDLTAGDVRAAFAAANPGLARAAVRVMTTRSGWINEVHLCLDQRFRYTPCPAWQSGAPDDIRVRIEPQR